MEKTYVMDEINDIQLCGQTIDVDTSNEILDSNKLTTCIKQIVLDERDNTN